MLLTSAIILAEKSLSENKGNESMPLYQTLSILVQSIKSDLALRELTEQAQELGLYDMPGSFTQQQKIKIYESLLHSIQASRNVTMDKNRLNILLDLICAWSKEHRGEKTSTEIDESVNLCLQRIKEFIKA